MAVSARVGIAGARPRLYRPDEDVCAYRPYAFVRLSDARVDERA